MMKKWSGFILLIVTFLFTNVMTGAHLNQVWQPFELLLAASVYFAFYLSTFGHRWPESVDSSRIRQTALSAFWPSIIINLGLGISHTLYLTDGYPEILHELVASIAICMTHSVLILSAMMCLGKREAG